jgi:hypothetical protein
LAGGFITESIDENHLLQNDSLKIFDAMLNQCQASSGRQVQKLLRRKRKLTPACN